jgi:hypothetical protein
MLDWASFYPSGGMHNYRFRLKESTMFALVGWASPASPFPFIMMVVDDGKSKMAGSSNYVGVLPAGNLERDAGESYDHLSPTKYLLR